MAGTSASRHDCSQCLLGGRVYLRSIPDAGQLVQLSPSYAASHEHHMQKISPGSFLHGAAHTTTHSCSRSGPRRCA